MKIEYCIYAPFKLFKFLKQKEFRFLVAYALLKVFIFNLKYLVLVILPAFVTSLMLL